MIEELNGNLETKVKLPYLKYTVEQKGWWIFKRLVHAYYIQHEFCLQGPYYNFNEALENLVLARQAYNV